MSLIGIEGGVENAKPSRDPSAILSFNWAARRQSQIEKWGPSSVQQKRTWKKDQVRFPVPRYHGAPFFIIGERMGHFKQNLANILILKEIFLRAGISSIF